MALLVVRIVMRYVVGALAAYGILQPAEVQELLLDPNLALALAGGLGGVVEGGYAVARRYGWPL